MAFKVVGIGEVLWDLLLTGPQLGGAPANFAYHSRALGCDASVITRVGDDEQGREVVRRFRNMGLPDTTVQVDEHALTGTVQVQLSGDGLAHFTIQENVAWDHIALTVEAVTIASSADAICFGSLAQRSQKSRDTIRKLVTAATPTLKVFDINLRQSFYSRDVIEESLKLSNVLKLNDDELPRLVDMFALTGSAENQIEQLAQAFDLRVIALTRGANGSLLYQELEEVPGGTLPRRVVSEPHRTRWSDCASRSVQVVDTVGAGDAFTAALVLGLLQKMDLDEINSVANEVARYVCSQPGATPQLPSDFRKKFGFSK
jgi:fructokinase